MSIFSKIGGAFKKVAKVATTPQRLAIKGVSKVLGGGGPKGAGQIQGVGMARPPMPPPPGGGYSGMATQPPPDPMMPPPPDMAVGAPGMGAMMAGMGAPMPQMPPGQAPGGPQPPSGLGEIAALLRAKGAQDSSSLLRSQYPGMGG